MSELIIEPIEKYGLNISHEKKALFSRVGVVGAGKEGRTIISLTASAGMDVVFMDESQERIDFVFEELNRVMDQKISKWGLTQSEKKVIMNRITPTLSYDDFAGCDLVIECTRYSESGRRSTPIRKNIFKILDDSLEPDAIIATNGPTVIISELAADLVHKERCVSLYFPVSHPDARILEIVKGMYTSEEVYNKMEIFAQLINYRPHRINESNGNVSIRLLTTMLNEACQMLLERVSSMESIEETFTIIYGQRYGVFRLADIIGIERIVTIMEAMFNDFGEKHYKPNPLLWKLYRSNQLGIRTGKGFYIYDENGNVISENRSLFN
ncbi:MAG TPA: 3-hydroxyacyl-CoA dehydrogenase family protein [Petrimonas sp.]|uniref:3-hydroxyacyl-CoA dehydrogenase family protein n=1 Tax=Petrimonas sp. TaxID=2023866 RepID=UPI00095C3D7A|nr:3-hydroxyacyl-CoA dehydrogenase family protein [Petrimonas sp.]MEA5042973.1 3-hydroxyacyl-CoA dehydrogenase family protein [Petrimonas sp.]MEA5063313.1 3-hydroxyacyl-CoA dehydrogenase family protein [Petrimonas sp.]OJV37360.1 MAG: 3-hydroxybutyryl-CoA dehydrogenase [Bacteroidia bacterium 43-41]HHV84516.1 3-hydroxyacyl-CoA dehydrogenase family protein [Petrimonas sp.]